MSERFASASSEKFTSQLANEIARIAQENDPQYQGKSAGEITDLVVAKLQSLDSGVPITKTAGYKSGALCVVSRQVRAKHLTLPPSIVLMNTNGQLSLHVY